MATVVGTNNPAVDIPAVQAAVNLGGDVLLEGHFSFNSAPTVPVAPALQAAGYPEATILVPTAVTISGAPGAKIDGGTIPFYVDASGASVTIQGLHFTGPTARGIVVYAANGLTIANCKIDGVVPFGTPTPTSAAIGIDTSGGVPTPASPGTPQNIYGRVVVIDNQLDLSGGTSSDNTLGITVFSVGLLPNNEADVYIVGNKIRNITEPAINLRRIGGRAYVEGNDIDTGSVSGQAEPPEVIRAVNTGSYVIAHNTIQCEWPDPQAVGIGVFSQIQSWPMVQALVADNSVTMSPPPATPFNGLSAGIDIRGFANSNVVMNNKIQGNARAALALDTFKGGSPANNTLIDNDVTGFTASIKDTVIGSGVTNTLLLAQGGTIEDDGTGTVILP